MKRVLCALTMMAAAGLAYPVRGDTTDDAQNPGVVAAQAELKKAQAKEAALEKQVADLKKQLAAAKDEPTDGGGTAAEGAQEPAKPAPKVARPAAKRAPNAPPAHIGEAKADLEAEFKSISKNGDEEVMQLEKGTVVSGRQLMQGMLPYVTRWTVTLKNGVVTKVRSEKLYPQ